MKIITESEFQEFTDTIHQQAAQIEQLREVGRNMQALALEASTESYRLTRHIEGSEYCFEKRKAEIKEARAALEWRE